MKNALKIVGFGIGLVGLSVVVLIKKFIKAGFTAIEDLIEYSKRKINERK